MGFETSLEPNLVAWEDVELATASSVNDDSLNDLFVLTSSSTMHGYAPAN